MNSGLGPTLTFIVGGILWLLYLAPAIKERSEIKTIERNARRIAATTQDLGIRPLTPMSEMSTRELIAHRRELERLARTKDRVDVRESRRATFAADPTIAARHRGMKLALSTGLLLSVAGGGIAAYFAAWSYLVLATGLALLAIIGLIAVNTADVPTVQATTVPAKAPRPVVDRTWTPIRTPPVHNSMPEGAGLIVTSEQEKAVVARERAERIRAQAALTAKSGLAIDPRFVTPVADAPAEETGSIDINAALRARRAN